MNAPNLAGRLTKLDSVAKQIQSMGFQIEYTVKAGDFISKDLWKIQMILDNTWRTFPEFVKMQKTVIYDPSDSRLKTMKNMIARSILDFYSPEF